MCIAVAGMVVEKDGAKARINVRGNLVSAELSLVDADLGDYVLVHAGCAISRLTKTEVEELDELYASMDAYNG